MAHPHISDVQLSSRSFRAKKSVLLSSGGSYFRYQSESTLQMSRQSSGLAFDVFTGSEPGRQRLSAVSPQARSNDSRAMGYTEYI